MKLKSIGIVVTLVLTMFMAIESSNYFTSIAYHS